jgi:hypothetical protein
MVKGLLELESGWWVFVGVLAGNAQSGEPRKVVLLAHYDPNLAHYDPNGEDEVATNRLTAVYLSRSEAIRLSAELTDAAEDAHG